MAFRYSDRMQEMLRCNAHGSALLRHIQACIALCRLLRAAALTQEERAPWQAEERGLVDAFLGLDRTAIQRDRHPHHLSRYQLGLQDGQTIIKVFESDSTQHRDHGNVQLTLLSGWDNRSLERTASRDTSEIRRHVA
jgi:hypothetical protein